MKLIILIWIFWWNSQIPNLRLWRRAYGTGLIMTRINWMTQKRIPSNNTANPFWWASLSLQERLMFHQSRFLALSPASRAGLKHRGRYFSRLGWVCLRGLKFFMTPIVDSYRIPLVHSNKNHSFCACSPEPLGTMSCPVFSARLFKDFPNFVENCQ